MAQSTLPPQAPERSWMSRVLGPLHVTGAIWFRLHRFAVSVLPEWAIRSGLHLSTLFFFCCLGGIRRALAGNLAAVLGPCGFWERQRRVFSTLKNFAWCMSERYERLVTERRVEATAEGEEHWREVVATGRGFILMTAHIGHWEVGSMLAPSMEQRHVHIVREEEMNPQAQAFMQELFDDQAGQGFTMHFAKDNPMLGVQLMRALQAGELVALQGDRPRATGGALTAQLFGRPLELPKGPAALARSTGCSILPVFVYRTGRLKSHIVFQQPITVPATDRRGADLEAAVQNMASTIETAIRRRPTQWFCFRRLWK